MKGHTNPNCTGYQKPVEIVELQRSFSSFKDCAKYLGVTPHTISKYFRGEMKTVKGYTLICK